VEETRVYKENHRQDSTVKPASVTTSIKQ